MLDVDFVLQRGDLRLAIALEVEAGEVVAVLGPNGAGKSTLLRVIAGLEPVGSGSVAVDGAVLDDPAAGVFVTPERRSIGMVFQDYVLFPNLDATENVAFGLRASGMRRATARAAAAQWLQRVGLGDVLARRPARLSGGQAQRVALARALVREPRVLLLDEPLAALDVTTRNEVRHDLRHHLESFAGVSVLVTHDPIDAYALADHVVILEAGAVTQSGALIDVAAHPRSGYVADLAGINLLAGDLRGHTLTTDEGANIVAAHAVGDGPAFVAVHPHAVAVHRRRPEGSARNVWQLTVHDVDVLHDRARVLLGGAVRLVAEVTPSAVDELALRPGDQVWASVKATEVDAYAR